MAVENFTLVEKGVYQSSFLRAPDRNMAAEIPQVGDRVSDVLLCVAQAYPGIKSFGFGIVNTNLPPDRLPTFSDNKLLWLTAEDLSAGKAGEIAEVASRIQTTWDGDEKFSLQLTSHVHTPNDLFGHYSLPVFDLGASPDALDEFRQRYSSFGFAIIQSGEAYQAVGLSLMEISQYVAMLGKLKEGGLVEPLYADRCIRSRHSTISVERLGSANKQSVVEVIPPKA